MMGRKMKKNVQTRGLNLGPLEQRNMHRPIGQAFANVTLGVKFLFLN
jgi:hypothetical protein